LDWTPTQKAFAEHGHKYPLSYLEFRSLLDKTAGVREVLPILQDFTSEPLAVSDMLRDDRLHLSLPHKSFKNRCTRLARKLLEASKHHSAKKTGWMRNQLLPLYHLRNNDCTVELQRFLRPQAIPPAPPSFLEPALWLYTGNQFQTLIAPGLVDIRLPSRTGRSNALLVGVWPPSTNPSPLSVKFLSRHGLKPLPLEIGYRWKLQSAIYICQIVKISCSQTWTT